MPLRLPQPPSTLHPNDLQRSVTDIITFLREFYDRGSKHAGFTQAQIDTFTDPSFLGTVLFNTTTNESNVSYLDAGVVKWRAF